MYGVKHLPGVPPRNAQGVNLQRVSSITLWRDTAMRSTQNRLSPVRFGGYPRKVLNTVHGKHSVLMALVRAQDAVHAQVYVFECSGIKVMSD
jgi:hypothetical protein